MDDEEQDWEEQNNNKTVAEQGFNLVNAIHIAILNIFIEELKNKDEKVKSSGDTGKDKEEEGETLDSSIIKYVEKPELVWPEMIRLILKSQKNFDFYPLDQQMQEICDKLCSCTPEKYNSLFTYEEKSILLETLIDGIHDLDDFRNFLNQRVEEKSSYNKQKIEIYAEIKQLENQKQELIKDHAQNNFFNNSEQILNQIEELKEKLRNATRVQSKIYYQQINELESEKNKILREI